jgi:hypothetical protein
LAKTKGQIFAGRFVPLSLRFKYKCLTFPHFQRLRGGTCFKTKKRTQKAGGRNPPFTLRMRYKKQFFAKQPLFCYDNHDIIITVIAP